MSDITDGTSSTLLVGESRYSPTAPNGTNGSWGQQSWASPFYYAGTTQTYPINAAVAVNPINAFEPNVPHPAEATNAETQTSTFGSWHVGGAVFLMADGSIRFLSENIDMSTYAEKLAIRNDGLVVGEF